MTDHSNSAESNYGGHDAAGAHDEHHGGTIKTYVAVFAALCILTGASFFTYFDVWRDHITPHVGWAFMMAVSCTKALLVILFFMHLKYEANWKYVLTIPAAFMSIFLILMLIPDVGMRMNRASSERKRNMAVGIDAHDGGHAEHAPAADH